MLYVFLCLASLCEVYPPRKSSSLPIRISQIWAVCPTITQTWQDTVPGEMADYASEPCRDLWSSLGEAKHGRRPRVTAMAEATWVYLTCRDGTCRQCILRCTPDIFILMFTYSPSVTFPHAVGEGYFNINCPKKPQTQGKNLLVSERHSR